MAQAKRKQKFFDISIPIIGKETQLYGYDLDEFNGKTIIYDLTRILRGKSITLSLKVVVKDDEAITVPKELKVMPYFIRRMMRKGTNYVEDSFSAECKDATVKIKPFLITRKKVPRKVRKALRELARKEIIEYLKNKTSEILFNDIMQNRLQKVLSTRLKKIYPLSMCEIRQFRIEKEKEYVEEVKEESVEKQVEIKSEEVKPKKSASKKKHEENSGVSKDD